MIAAALVGPLLLSIIGLSAGQWRLLGSGAGRGAGRLAVASGRGSAALGGLLMRSWQRGARAHGGSRAGSTDCRFARNGRLSRGSARS